MRRANRRILYTEPMLRARGFTLVELLVSIAIIGLLSSIVLASLSTARDKALDAQRMANTRTLKNALQMYANDHNGMFPPDPVVPESVSALTAALSSYIPRVPDDPHPTTTGWKYASCNSSCSAYALLIYTETAGWCRTSDVNMLGWWGTTASCTF